MRGSVKPDEDLGFGYHIACGQGHLGYRVGRLKHKPGCSGRFQGCSCCSASHSRFFLVDVKRRGNLQRYYLIKCFIAKTFRKHWTKVPFKSTTVQHVDSFHLVETKGKSCSNTLGCRTSFLRAAEYERPLLQPSKLSSSTLGAQHAISLFVCLLSR